MQRVLKSAMQLSLRPATPEKVSSKSAYYLPSRYIEGVIFNQQEKYKSAVRAFRDVYREEVDVYNDAREVRKMNDLKDLS